MTPGEREGLGDTCNSDCNHETDTSSVSAHEQRTRVRANHADHGMSCDKSGTGDAIKVFSDDLLA